MSAMWRADRERRNLESKKRVVPVKDPLFLTGVYVLLWTLFLSILFLVVIL